MSKAGYYVEHETKSKAKEFLHELADNYECALREYYCNVIIEPKEIQFDRYVKKEAAKSRYDGALGMYERIFREAKV